MTNRLLLAFLILHSSFLISPAQPITPPIPSTPFTRSWLRSTNAAQAVDGLGLTGINLTNYQGAVAEATNALHSVWATNIPWSAVTTAAEAAGEANLTLATLNVGDVVGGSWGVANNILYGNGSGLTNIPMATNTQGGVLKLGPTFETTLTSDANGLTVENLGSARINFSSGGPSITGGATNLNFSGSVGIRAAPRLAYLSVYGPPTGLAASESPYIPSHLMLNAAASSPHNGAVLNFSMTNSFYNTIYHYAAIAGIAETATNSATPRGYMKFGTTDGGTMTEKMRLTRDGRLGIGMTNPATLLDVNGTVTALAANVTNTLGASNIFSPSITATNFSIILTNGTPSNSVFGMLVEMNPASNFCYQACAASSQTPIGVVLDDGIAPGGRVRIADRGIVQVLTDSASTTNWPGSWFGSSATTAGRAVILTDPPTAGVHDREIGHGLMSRGFAASDSVTNLTWVLLHIGR